jgi:hypothetical protein
MSYGMSIGNLCWAVEIDPNYHLAEQRLSSASQQASDDLATLNEGHDDAAS